MTPTDNPKVKARLNVRFDDELRSRVEAAARSSLRSMNSEIIYRLKTSFERADEASEKFTASTSQAGGAR